MATFPTAANGRLKQYNSDSYDATSNPYGMADGGHRENFPMATDDVSAVGEFVADTGGEVQTAATQVAQNLVDTNAARDLARRWASQAEDVEVAGGFGSAFNYAQKAARSATAAATFEPAKFTRQLNVFNEGGAPLDSNFNDFTEPGPVPRLMRSAVDGPFVANAPETNAYFYVLNFVFSTNVTQVAFPYAGQQLRAYWRSRISGTWSAWRTFVPLASPTIPGIAQEGVDTEADAGTVTVSRVWSPARLFRAARAALPLVTQAVAQAGVDTVARSWSVERVWQAIRAAIPEATDLEAQQGLSLSSRSWAPARLFGAVRAVIANDKELLVASYTPAQLDGLVSIILDMPAGFNKYRIEFGGLRLRSGTGLMTLRNGPSGGALNSGATAYQNTLLQQRGNITDALDTSENAFVVTQLGTQNDQGGEIVIDDLPNQFWTAGARFVGRDTAGAGVVSMRLSTYASGGGRWGRIGLQFNGTLASAGYVRIYGVRT